MLLNIPNSIIDPTARIEPGAVIYDHVKIGKLSVIGANAVLRPRTTIGSNTIFGPLSVSEGDNFIGNYVTIHAQCHITKGVTIGDNCFIAPFFIATNTPEITEGKHGMTLTGYPQLLSTVIENDVRIGANVRMIPGKRIGHHSVIDQDTLITKNIPPYSHVRGGKDKVGKIIRTLQTQ